MRILRKSPVLLAAGLLTFASALLAICPASFCRPWWILERNFEDQLVRIRGPRRASPQIVQVVIDDSTLAEGHWFEQQDQIPSWAVGMGSLPWPRARYGDLLEPLLEAGADVVALNVVFAGESVFGPADDKAFIAALLPYQEQFVLAAEMIEAEDQLGAGAISLLLPVAADATELDRLSLGLSNIFPPGNGARFLQPEFYATTLDQPLGHEPLRSLPVAALEMVGRPLALDLYDQTLNFYGPEPEPLRLDRRCLPPAHGFLRLSAKNVINPRQWAVHPCRERVEGAVVLVGVVVSEGGSALSDLPSPFGDLSGMEVLATSTANALTRDGLRSWPRLLPMKAGLVGSVVLLALSLAFHRTNLAWRFGVLIASAGLWVVLCYLLMVHHHVWIPVLTPPAALVVGALIYGGEEYRRTSTKRRLTRRWLQRCVDPSVVGPMLSDPSHMEALFEGQLKSVTVMFADLQGFTALTRKRSEQGRVRAHLEQLNHYLDEMRSLVWDHHGFLDKFLGDAVMAVFGLPESRGESAEARSAICCAMAMRESLIRLNQIWEAEGMEPLECGIGIASGIVVAGGIGGRKLGGLSVIGDTVNLASRLENLTRSLDKSILFDQSTAELAGKDFAIRSIGTQQLKGMGMVEVYMLSD
ncbi:MAG: adenylate/guanylate cyclase domain-containing protein [Prochlorococcus sp.]|nr:adenylate/guanylate cyclase domain-containing protein [Prochlorococcaceae cyanobacterium ETNP14_MAG_4]